jgi:hypothetical protein
LDLIPAFSAKDLEEMLHLDLTGTKTHNFNAAYDSLLAVPGLIKIAQRRLLGDPGYVDRIYGENEMGGTSWMYLSKVPFEKIGFDTTLAPTAAPKQVYWFLWTIPLWHTSLTALLAAGSPSGLRIAMRPSARSDT